MCYVRLEQSRSSTQDVRKVHLIVLICRNHFSESAPLALSSVYNINKVRHSYKHICNYRLGK